ncbi:MAG: coproporphyrinogen dehydrogenase HemZ, partial [Lachnoclostridium sp.]|nr:coproporphyrinogen dehydrogenase HemZ [Lachnoclostridium sp.]
MIYLYQNDREYDYDVRAIALAFFEREKIIEVSEEELKQQVTKCQAPETEQDLNEIRKEHPRFFYLYYEEGKIIGRLSDWEGKSVSRTLECDYRDHGKCRNQVCRFLYQIISDYTGRDLPWGMLTGIRPTKIVMKWMEEETDIDQLEKKFSDTYLADPQKAHLCCQVAAREKKILSARDYEKEYSLYIGIPFCPTTCLYC